MADLCLQVRYDGSCKFINNPKEVFDMGILDKVSKKFSATGSDLKSKVATFSNVTKLNSEIHAETQALEKLYADLGRQCYQAHVEKTDVDPDTLCDAIFAKIEQVETMKQELLVLKNAKICPVCGNECPKEVIFCAGCGSRFAMPAVSTAGKVCAGCGRTCAEDALFCDGCGMKFQPPAPEPEEEKKVCPNCDKECPADACFCNGCGTAFAAAEPEPEEADKICANCGNACPAEALFCNGCGTPFAASQPEPMPEPEPEPTSKVCPNCDAELPLEAVFCPNCGTRQ